MKLTALVRELEKILGREAVLWRPDDLMLYEYDGLSSLRPPDVVVSRAGGERRVLHVVELLDEAYRQRSLPDSK